MRWIIGLALVLVADPSSALAQDAGDASEILERASLTYSRLDGFCARFEQDLEVVLLNRTTHSSGRLCQMRPNFFLMDFSDPDGDRVVADGAFLWIYQPSTQVGQVVRRQLSASTGGVNFQKEFLEEPGVRYASTLEGEELVGGSRTHRIRLVPRERSAYTRATVWVDSDQGVIRRLEIEQENGTVRRLELSDLKTGIALTRSDFSFTPPAGVHVVGG